MAQDLTAAWAEATEAARESTREDKRLPEARPIAPIPPRVGTSKPPAAAGTGGGIASPLTETAYEDRTWHASTMLTTTDGFMSVIVPLVNKIKYTDANDAVVELIHKAPV